MFIKFVSETVMKKKSFIGLYGVYGTQNLLERQFSSESTDILSHSQKEKFPGSPNNNATFFSGWGGEG